MPEPMTLLLALAGIVLVVYTFSTIDLVKDSGRTIALVLVVVLIVMMSDRLLPLVRRQNFSFDRLSELRYLINPFAVRIIQPGWQDLPYILSNQPLPQRPASLPPVVSRPPTASSTANSARNYPQTVEPYLNGGVAPPPPIVPPYSNQPDTNRPAPVPPAPSGNRPSVPPGSKPSAPPGSRPITGLW